MDRESLFELCDRALEAALARGAESAEVAATSSRNAEVSFEKNDINTAITDEETSIGLRVYRAGREGFATTNDPENIEETVEDALGLSAASLVDPLLGLPEARAIVPVEGLHDPAVTECGIEHVTELGSRLLEAVRSVDARPSVDSGSVSAGESLRVVVSSTGVRAAELASGIDCGLFGMAVDGDQVGSFVVEGRSSRRLAGFEEEVDLCARRFAEKALGALEPGKGRSYKGKILLVPEATASIFVSNMLGMLSPAAIRKGRSPFKGENGEEIASPLICLRDEPRVAGEVSSSAFDREGMPREELELVVDGRVGSIPYNAYEARAAGRSGGSNGHALGGSTAMPMVGTTRPILAPGASSRAEIMAAAEGCVVVSRFSGSTNGVTGEFSGVVKAGFLIEGGEPRPITETLIAGNLLDLYRDVIAVSSDTEKVYGRLPYPWLLLDGVSVTAG